QVASVTDGRGTTTHAYDARERLAKVTYPARVLTVGVSVLSQEHFDPRDCTRDYDLAQPT
ncbi:MAG TPA: hypothetical protein PLX06_13975, partial [Fimbriimonadaceae bacterium]|nr:hypothetical protein [Fimbriimonadaceae bacterium]